ELQSIGRTVTLLEFITAAAIDLEDVYRSRGWSWTRLQREAGLFHHAPGRTMRIADAPPSDDDRLLLGASRLLHIDDPERIAFLRALLSRDASSSNDLSTRERRIVEGFLM